MPCSVDASPPAVRQPLPAEMTCGIGASGDVVGDKCNTASDPAVGLGHTIIYRMQQQQSLKMGGINPIGSGYGSAVSVPSHTGSRQSRQRQWPQLTRIALGVGPGEFSNQSNVTSLTPKGKGTPPMEGGKSSFTRFRCAAPPQVDGLSPPRGGGGGLDRASWPGGAQTSEKKKGFSLIPWVARTITNEVEYTNLCLLGALPRGR